MTNELKTSIFLFIAALAVLGTALVAGKTFLVIYSVYSLFFAACLIITFISNRPGA